MSTRRMARSKDEADLILSSSWSLLCLEFLVPVRRDAATFVDNMDHVCFEKEWSRREGLRRMIVQNVSLIYLVNDATVELMICLF